MEEERGEKKTSAGKKKGPKKESGNEIVLRKLGPWPETIPETGKYLREKRPIKAQEIHKKRNVAKSFFHF